MRAATDYDNAVQAVANGDPRGAVLDATEVVRYPRPRRPVTIDRRRLGRGA